MFHALLLSSPLTLCCLLFRSRTRPRTSDSSTDLAEAFTARSGVRVGVDTAYCETLNERFKRRRRLQRRRYVISLMVILDQVSDSESANYWPSYTRFSLLKFKLADDSYTSNYSVHRHMLDYDATRWAR